MAGSPCLENRNLIHIQGLIPLTHYSAINSLQKSFEIKKIEGVEGPPFDPP